MGGIHGAMLPSDAKWRQTLSDATPRHQSSDNQMRTLQEIRTVALPRADPAAEDMDDGLP